MVSAPLWQALAFKTTVSMSNLPGPQFKLKWLGHAMKSMHFFVVPQNTIGVFITIFSYDGEVSISMSADERLVTQAEARRITTEYFPEEIDRLHEIFVGDE